MDGCGILLKMRLYATVRGCVCVCVVFTIEEARHIYHITKRMQYTVNAHVHTHHHHAHYSLSYLISIMPKKAIPRVGQSPDGHREHRHPDNDGEQVSDKLSMRSLEQGLPHGELSQAVVYDSLFVISLDSLGHFVACGCWKSRSLIRS